MFALIRKDLIACRLFLLIGIVLYVLWAISTLAYPLGYFVTHIAAVIALVLMPIVVDDKYRADELMCYLPTARHQIVLARYVEAMIALFIGLAAHYGLGAILSNHIGEPGFRTLCSPQAVLVFCVVPVVFAALYLPCCFRLGLGRGSFVFAVISVILMTLITSPVFVTDVLSAGGGFVLTREMLQHPETVLVSLIDHVAAIVGKRRFFVTVSIGIIALIATSVTFSIRFFNRRDF